MGNSPGRWIDKHLTPRLTPAAWLIVLVPLGLVVRAVFVPAIGEHLGNLLWGAMWVAAVWLVWPRWPLIRTAVAALLIVWGIELFQPTGIPAAAARGWPMLRWLVGTTFAVYDLIGNGVGVVAGAFAIRQVSGKR